MPLTLAQRLQRLRVRLDELPLWAERDSRVIEGWTIDGAPIALGERWPERTGEHHFAAAFSLPSKWPLAETRLYLDVGGESLVTVTYGRATEESYGLDPFHREFPVKARKGRLRTISTARLPFGQPVREPRLEIARLILIDPHVRALSLLLEQVVETAEFLGEQEVVPHLLDLAEAALRGLDWPSATQDYVARISSQSGQLGNIWEYPEIIPDPAPLNQAERASVAAAHTALVAGLKRLKRRFPQQGHVAVTGHAHIDLCWLWPYDETRRKLRRTFHTALRLMETSEDFRFNQSTAHYYWQVAQDDPALFAAIKDQVAAGKWEPVGGLWIEPDTNMPTGESLARQVLYGQRYFEATFGARHDICWLPDCFGFTAALPQLLRQGGMRSFFTIKVNWSETNRFPHDLFWWQGLDGSRVLTHTFDNPGGGYNGDLRASCLVPTWTNFRGKTLHDTSLLSVGYGDGGGGVTPQMVDREVLLRDFPRLPEARWAKVSDVFADMHATAAHAPVPTWQGEIYLELHRATLTTQSNTKRLHRRAERALITAETVASMACLMGGPQPANLEDAWRTVLKNEFHDILPGSSIREVYVEAERELSDAIGAGLSAQAAGLDALARRLPKGTAKDALMVVNPAPQARRMDITTADGTALSGSAMVPGLGVAVVAVADIQPAGRLSVSRTRLENDHLAVTIGADGTVTSLIHKATGREAIDGRGNQLWAYPMDKPRSWDAWDIEEDYASRGEELRSVESISVTEKSAHRVAVTVTRTYRHSTISQTYRLTAAGQRLDIVTEIDWHDRRVLLRVLNPVAVRADVATFECAFGVVQRSTHDNTSWDAAKFEVPGHRFVDMSEPGFGVALLNDAKYGHSAKGNVMGLSLVRGAIYPDPLADEGRQLFTLSLYPHAGAWHEGGVRQEAEDLNQPLLVVPVKGRAAGAWSALPLGGYPAALGALKPAEDGRGIILRLYEPAGGRGNVSMTLPEGWARSGPLTILEEPMERVAGPDLMPFEVVSWRLATA